MFSYFFTLFLPKKCRYIKTKIVALITTNSIENIEEKKLQYKSHIFYHLHFRAYTAVYIGLVTVICLKCITRYYGLRYEMYNILCLILYDLNSKNWTQSNGHQKVWVDLCWALGAVSGTEAAAVLLQRRVQDTVAPNLHAIPLHHWYNI